MARTTGYATGNDSTTEVSATGSASGGTAEPDETDIVESPRTLLDQKIIELIESAGREFNYKTAAPGTIKKIVVDDSLAAAMIRLDKAAPLLNLAVLMAQRRGALLTPLERILGKTKGSPSGSTSGSTSGSESGSASGSHNTRRNAPGSAGSESGSTSGEMSKALMERFLAGDRSAGLELMRLR